MNMDATNNKRIKYSVVNGIAIDRKTQKIYWIDTLVKIMSSNYDGDNENLILKESVNILSLAYFDDKLFWLWTDNNQNDTSLRSCTLKNKTCRGHYLHLLTFSNATIIKAFSHSKEIMKDISNPCVRRNGGCQQMCVLTSHENAGRSCACYSGWQLKSDLMSCQPINQFILQARKNVIRGYSINGTKTKSTNSIFPIWIDSKSLIHKSSLEITYNTKSEYLYASDDTYIYKVSLKGPSNQTIIICNITEQYYINNIAFDWRTEYLFYIKRSLSSSNEHSIMIYDTKRGNASHQTLYSFSYTKKVHLDGCPDTLIVHPNGEYIFYCLEEFYTNSNYKVAIYQVNINSTNQTVYFDEYHKTRWFRLNALAIDSETNYLWWLRDNNLNRYDDNTYEIKSVDLQTNIYSEATQIRLDGKVNMLYVYSHWVYVSYESKIYRLFKPISYDGYIENSSLSVDSLP